IAGTSVAALAGMNPLPSTRASSRALFGWAGLLAVVLAACAGPPAAVGGSCDPGVTTGDRSTTTISSPALECAGRTCVQMGGGPAFCSAECTGPDDCREISAGGTACRGGFTCAVATTAGDYACRRLCVCRDTAPPASSSCPP